ncbi:MAG: RNA polymerase sigma factor [Clostridia bacterium]|nr:RNA polymerase sigma factor [Clostridia bacterium]
MQYKNESDETLVLLTLAGEQTAYEALVTRYQTAAVSAAMSVTKSRFMAEDAAQDAFVTAWMKLNTLQDPKKYRIWLCRIAKNCALNMIGRYRSFIPLETIENLYVSDDSTHNPAEIYALSEEKSELNKSIEMLPEKVRQIIYLHYFENLSIAEIADRMRISEGTVKWQLHDGRKRIRKELCAMDEKYSDTLVKRVMKKVEELKSWQVKNDKSGFEKVYKEVLKDVEELPECREKQHALADVLMRGWWWLPGKKNDALFARIADAAMQGKNEEVMTFIVTREDSKVYGGAKIEFIRDKQIPRLEKAGFVQTLGHEWFWLAYNYFREGNAEEGHAAYDKVERILGKSDAYRVLVPHARKMESIIDERYKDKSERLYAIGVTADEYRYIDNSLRFWKSEGIGKGWMQSVDRQVSNIFCNSSSCDGHFFADLTLGETFVGSDGTTLTYASDSEAIDTPAGRFEGCKLWTTSVWGDEGRSVFKSYYKENVGIVKHIHTHDGVTEARLLSAYEIKSGDGLLPIGEGNRWDYVSEYDPDSVITELAFTVSFADSKKVVISSFENIDRLKYDDNSWLEMIGQIRCDYCRDTDGRELLCDVSHAIERAEQLASTKTEKAHTKAAVSVVRRILETDPEFNPEHTATGHWNFFGRDAVQRKKDSLCLCHNYRWSFEWKNTGSYGLAEMPVLYNDILGILQDATNCIWSDEWRIGATPLIEYTRWSRDVKTQIVCEDAGTVTTKAGSFDNCLKVCLDISGMNGGWSYRGGKKVYYFADGIGIVRTENEYCKGLKTAVYELTHFEGRGEGFMPLADGMVRKYDALELTDGFVGATEYTYVADADGDIIIFSDRIGIREVPPPITQYCAIQSEIIEQQLSDSGNWQAGQLMHGVNNFHLMLHFLARPSHNIYTAKRSIELHSFNMQLMELLGENGEVPPAWYSLYSWCALIRSAAHFGNGENENGYESLEKALEYAEKFAAFDKGALLDTGKEQLLGGVKYVKGNGCILLPDGKRDPVNYDFRIDADDNLIFSVLTRRSGWEWFNSVRGEERFKQYIERAKKISDK